MTTDCLVEVDKELVQIWAENALQRIKIERAENRRRQWGSP